MPIRDLLKDRFLVEHTAWLVLRKMKRNISKTPNSWYLSFGEDNVQDALLVCRQQNIKHQSLSVPSTKSLHYSWAYKQEYAKTQKHTDLQVKKPPHKIYDKQLFAHENASRFSPSNTKSIQKHNICIFRKPLTKFTTIFFKVPYPVTLCERFYT